MKNQGKNHLKIIFSAQIMQQFSNQPDTCAVMGFGIRCVRRYQSDSGAEWLLKKRSHSVCNGIILYP